MIGILLNADSFVKWIIWDDSFDFLVFLGELVADYTRLGNLGMLLCRTRKLGLVWERNELEAENALNDAFVLMDLLPEWSCGQTPYRNLLIEGDNFDALRYLRMTFQGRIKCIYIDPPYNTGNKDFIYNDRFVDQDDIYRHSVWLEYLFARLTLVKDLLRDAFSSDITYW